MPSSRSASPPSWWSPARAVVADLRGRHDHSPAARPAEDRDDGVVKVDLFSDTVTRPTAPMRRFMCEAEVGDEQQREDPTVNLLQDMVADILGKESALFLPSGTMCNQVAFAVHCRAGDEILLQELAHPLLYEAGGAAALIGAVFRPLAEPGWFLHRPLRSTAAIRPPVHFMPRTRAVSIEQTSASIGGVCWPLRQIEEVCAAAHAGGLVAHMDGARFFNAVVASGTPARAFAAPFDSVWIDLSKGLGRAGRRGAGRFARLHRGGLALQAAFRRRHAPGRHHRRCRRLRPPAPRRAAGGRS